MKMTNRLDAIRRHTLLLNAMFARPFRLRLIAKGRSSLARLSNRLTVSIATTLIFGAATTAAQNSYTPTAEAQMRSAFASSLVLTDSEAITFGALSFDPEVLAAPLDGDEFGSDESVERRSNIRTFVLPAQWELPSSATYFTPHVKARLSYLEAEQDVVTAGNGDSTEDAFKDRVYGGYLESGFSYQLAERWTLRVGAGVHLMQYDNRFRPSNPVADVVEPATDGSFLNTHATAVVGEVQPRLIYMGETRGVPWEYQSTYSYYAGETVRTEDSVQNVRPETWSWSNGLTIRWPLPQMFNTSNQLRLLARRIDVGGDVTGPLGTDEYYEFGVGWLWEGPEDSGWLDNAGISISLNAGSALSGGALVLLYNEEW